MDDRTAAEKQSTPAVLCVLAAFGLACSSRAARPGAEGQFTWTQASPCPLARFEANGAVVDDELWVMGGFTAASLTVTRSVDIYDPETDTWRAGPELPGAETHFAVVTLGRDLVVAGGFTGAFGGGVRPPVTDAVSRWNAETETWDYGPALPTRGAGFAWALLGTNLHVAGGLAEDGNTDADVHYVWDTAGAVEWTTAAPLPNPRNHGSGAASGASFYAIAGRHGWNERSGAVADVHAFDPESDTWIARAPLPSARSEIGASTWTLADGRILVIGGSLPGIVPSDEVFLYDPSSDEWSSLPPLPEKRKGAVAVQIGERLVVTTGSPTSTDPSATTWVGCCL